MNNKYTIKVGHPLLRPGLTIETEASEKYLESVVRELMDQVRNINMTPMSGIIDEPPRPFPPPLVDDD